MGTSHTTRRCHLKKRGKKSCCEALIAESRSLDALLIRFETLYSACNNWTCKTKQMSLISYLIAYHTDWSGPYMLSTKVAFTQTFIMHGLRSRCKHFVWGPVLTFIYGESPDNLFRRFSVMYGESPVFFHTAYVFFSYSV